MSCSTIMTTTLSVTGLLMSLSSLYVTTMLATDNSYVPPCDLSPTLNCSAFLTSPYSTGLGLVHLTLGENHSANLPNSIFSIAIFSIILLTSFISNKMLITLLILLSTISISINSTIAILPLPIMCPINISTLATAFLMTISMMCKRGSSANNHSFPRPPKNNNNQAFKKFI